MFTGYCNVTRGVYIVQYVTGEYKRVCYYTNWAQYRPGKGKFFPENIDGSLCTHINYAFAKMKGNSLWHFEWNDESTAWSKGMCVTIVCIEFYNGHKSRNWTDIC